jgi:hypothetical protein
MLLKFRLLLEFRLVDVRAFADVSEFSVASTLLVGIDHPWSALTLPVGTTSTLPVGTTSTLPVGTSSISLLIGIDTSGRHRPTFWSASTLPIITASTLPVRTASTLPIGSSQPSGWYYALHSFLVVAIVTLPTRPSDPHGSLAPWLIQRVRIKPTTQFGFLRSVWPWL